MNSGGQARSGSAEEDGKIHAWPRRTATFAATAPRGHGGAGHGAGAPRPDRRPDRLQHGRRGVLALCRARRRAARVVRHRRPQSRSGASDHDAARRGPRRPDRGDAPSRSRCPTRRTIPPSPTSRRRARKSISPSSACRCCAAALRSGVLVVQNRARRTYSEEEIEALQTTAMLLAEMIASGELQAIAGPGVGDRAPPAAFPAGRADRRRASGLGHVVLHQPRVVVTKIVADDVGAELARLETRDRGDARLGRRADRSQRRRRRRRASRRARSVPHDRPRPRLASPPARGGRRRAHRRGGGRARAERRARQIATPDRSLSARSPARPHRHRQPPAASTRRAEPRAAAGANCPRTPSSSRARWARRRCSTTTARGCAGSCWRRRARRAISRSSRARWRFRPSATSPNISEIVEHGDAIIVDGVTGEVHLRPQPRRRGGLSPRRRVCARGGRSSIARCATRRASPRDGVADRPAHERRPVDRSAASRRRPARSRSACSAPNCNSCSRSRFPRLDAQEALYRDGAGRGRRAAGDVPHARYRRRQGAALYERRRGGKSGAGLARGPHRPRPAGAAAHCRLRAMLRAGAGPPIARHDADGLDCRRVHRGARVAATRTRLRRALRPRAAADRSQLGVMVEVPSLLWQLDEIADARRFSVGRLERPDAISLRRRPRQQARRATGSIRLSAGFLRALKAIADVGDAPWQAGRAVRRDRRAAARGDGADRARLSRPVDVGGGDRSDEGDGAVAGRRRGGARDRGAARPASGARGRVAARAACARFAERDSPMRL